MRKRNRAFTLIELLVVVFIIALLAAILMPSLSSLFERGRKKAAMVELQQIQIAIALYEENYRDFPPTLLEDLGLKQHNQINAGIESLVLCLSSQHKNGSFYPFRESQLENTDSDLSPVPLRSLTKTIFNTNELFEFMDPWGNPYLYFHYRDIKEATQQFYMLQGEKVSITPNLKRTKTGNLRGASRYQILSAGQDGILHNEDDLMSE